MTCLLARMLLTVLVGVVVVITVPAAADSTESGDHGNVHPWFNEDMIVGLHSDLPVENAMAMFGQLFNELSPRVVVYPTENYYYFSFTARGRSFSGNFRLSPRARADGRIHFAYFDVGDPAWLRHIYLGAEHGVDVKEADHLEYDVSFEGRTVRFVLNDLSQIPPALHLQPSERFVGRSHDESGLVFLLVYNTQTQSFLWILDDVSNQPMRLVPLDGELVVDIRTLFVFYRDAPYDRFLLAGVNRKNIISNNYFDGPFDQLPDNYIETTPFAEYVAEAYPAFRGLLNRRGESADGTSRLAVAPYMSYGSLQELIAHNFACHKAYGRHSTMFYACMFYDDKNT